jgi:processive 1,2-diacylglycerol beta-glucosyltransferase
MKNVLILTASMGGGHNSASNAIKEYSDMHRKEYNVKIIDILEYIQPVLSIIAGKSYEINAKSFPELYGVFYDLNNTTEAKLTKNNISIFFSKLKELIKEYNPDYVVCVHPVAISSIIKTRKKYGFEFKTIVLMTDFDFHSTWVNREVDMFIVSSQFMKYRLENEKILPYKIKTTGIPTSMKMKNKIEIQEARKNLGLKDKQTVLIMGGSFGAGNLKKLMDSLGKSDLDLQYVFIAGNNKRTKKALEKHKENYDKDIFVEGFTQKISLYMDASDVLITKPGGLTVTEALIKRIPIIINKPIPGQEEENAIYLQNKGLAVRITKENEAAVIIKDLINDEKRLEHMKVMAAHYGKPDAAKDFFEVLDEFELLISGQGVNK